MIALLVADSDISFTQIEKLLQPCGFNIVRYRSAVKALDNLEEIKPDAVFISTGDFPRHWKSLVQFIRSDTDKDHTVCILLTNERFSAEEADKAQHIGVQGFVGESLNDETQKDYLLHIFSRYKSVDASSFRPASDVGIFLFTNPLNDTIITGKLESLSLSQIRFRPDTPSAIAELCEGETIKECSLKVENKIFSPICRIKKTGNSMTLEIVQLKESERTELGKLISL